MSLSIVVEIVGKKVMANDEPLEYDRKKIADKLEKPVGDSVLPSAQIPCRLETKDQRAALNQSSGTMSSATMLMILMSGFTAGPAVSL